MSDTRPLVTVLVPARDEARDIADCLASVRDQSYPRERLEVIVVTGGSVDDTARRARRALSASGFHRTAVIEDAPGDTPGNLNVGLAAATGELVCRVDARSIVTATSSTAGSSSTTRMVSRPRGDGVGIDLGSGTAGCVP